MGSLFPLGAPLTVYTLVVACLPPHGLLLCLMASLEYAPYLSSGSQVLRIIDPGITSTQNQEKGHGIFVTRFPSRAILQSMPISRRAMWPFPYRALRVLKASLALRLNCQ